MVVSVLSTASFAADEETLTGAADPASSEFTLDSDLNDVESEDGFTENEANADIGYANQYDDNNTKDAIPVTISAEPAAIRAQTFQLAAQVDGCDINLQSIDQAL